MRRQLAVIAVALLTLALAGCARPADVRAAGPIELSFWNGFTGPDGATMERMVAAFQRENPDIRVRMQIIPWAQYYDKLTLGLAFHEGPDVFICQAGRLPEFAQYGVCRDLAPLQRGERAASGLPGLPDADFLPQPWAIAHYAGRLAGIPLDCHPLGLYYNRKLFRDAGIVDARGVPLPPRTWPEFLADAHRLTKRLPDGTQQWGFAFTNQHTNWYAFVWQNGGRALTPDLRRAAMDQPPAVRATEQMRSLITRERVAPNPEGTDAWMGFRQGRVAMEMEGIYMLGDLQKSQGLDYAGAPIPAFGPIPATWVSSHFLCIPASASDAKTRAAWRLIHFLSDHSLDWAAGGQVPVRRSLLDTPRFRSMTVQAQFARQLPYVRYEPPTTHATEMIPFLDAAIEASLLGLEPPAQALHEAAGRIDRALARP